MGDANEVKRLIAQLSQAESELVAAMGKVDSVVDPGGHVYLLRHAQKALLVSESRAQEQAALLSAILDSSPDYITCLDLDRRVLFANRIGADFSRDEVMGADWLALQLPDQREALGRIFDRVVATGEPASFEGPGHGPAATIAHYSRRFGCVRRAGAVVGVVITTRDVTQQKATEAQLMVADRMASIGTLAAGVAHEINNPLAAVIGNLDLAIDEIKTHRKCVAISGELEEELDDARAAAESVRVIVRDLKIFSRAEDDARGPVDVERVMESTLRMAWNEIRHRARLTKEYGRVPLVEANESRLGQVFLNLVVNAAQAISEGNAELNLIRISTSCDEQGRVALRVSDTGAGIPADVQKRLFTPFFTTKPVGAGTGLGLSICHRIVTSFGGEIRFQSELGKGTEFCVLLPAAQVVMAPTVAERRLSAPSSRRGRVLVVDDELAVANTAKRILAASHEVLVIDDSRHALELLRSGERFDAVLCDLMMPQVTGMDLHAEVARLDQSQADRFVFITGGAFTPRAREFLDAVSNHRVEKPFDLQGLRAIVGGLIGVR